MSRDLAISPLSLSKADHYACNLSHSSAEDKRKGDPMQTLWSKGTQDEVSTPGLGAVRTKRLRKEQFCT